LVWKTADKTGLQQGTTDDLWIDFIELKCVSTPFLS